MGVAVATVLLHRQLGSALLAAVGADRRALTLAAFCQLVATIGPSLLWRTGFRVSGSAIGSIEACALYGTGSLANSVLPARAGSALRLGLFSRTLPAAGRLRASARALASIGVARQIALLTLVVAGVTAGRASPWDLTIPVVWLTIVAAALRRLRGTVSLPMLGWAALVILARAGVVVTVLASVAVEHVVGLAILVVLALEVAAIVPLTPGNIGVASAAVAAVLSAHGVGTGPALAVGVLLHAVETVVGIGFGGVAAAIVAVSGRWPVLGLALPENDLERGTASSA